MEYTTLTGTGMEVSRLCLGTMSFSEDGEGWNVDRAQSRELVERAIELGITFFDTANTYNDGESEAELGDVVADYDREEFVLSTKGRWGAGAE
jgi:aryl-alcohol dehydrogenase-like predicted oxidoreductase